MLYVALSWHEDCISNALTNMLLQAVENLTALLHVLISVSPHVSPHISLQVNLHVRLQALLGDKASRRAMRQAVHHFISLRRYEQMSVHEAMQGIKLATVPALQPHIPHGMYPFSSPFLWSVVLHSTPHPKY